MRRAPSTLLSLPRPLQRLYSTQRRTTLQYVDTLPVPLGVVDLDTFRLKAFIPEKPILLSAITDGNPDSASFRAFSDALPAASKWFDPDPGFTSRNPSGGTTARSCYLATFGATILPYEYIVDKSSIHFHDHTTGTQVDDGGTQNVLSQLQKLSEGSDDGTFHRFNAPLSLILDACKLRIRPQLYIAQAQIVDLPKKLQDDLPIPFLVQKVGRGDVYDSNVWIGIPPTYTPLHKDPNPNIFVQLSGRKRVRIFRPSVGSTIFNKVQQSIGAASATTIRGDEMMMGPERNALDEAVWGQSMQYDGYQAVVNPGDALFIPKGWWHSFKSDESVGINASVNWWFR